MASKADFTPFAPRIKAVGVGARESIAQSTLYDWTEVAYLFEDGIIPVELL